MTCSVPGCPDPASWVSEAGSTLVPLCGRHGVESVVRRVPVSVTFRGRTLALYALRARPATGMELDALVVWEVLSS